MHPSFETSALQTTPSAPRETSKATFDVRLSGVKRGPLDCFATHSLSTVSAVIAKYVDDYR
jgi:hypothetical protein